MGEQGIEKVELTSTEQVWCNGLQELHPEAGSWCWVDGRGSRYNGFTSPQEALLDAKKQKAVEPIHINPLQNKV